MRESAVLFGEAHSLVGVVTEPDSSSLPSARPAVIILNAGIVHHVGPNRLHPKIARTLAQAGFRVMRFDLSGLGDSEIRKNGLSHDLTTLRDIQEAMDFLNTSHGVDQFVLMGICSGADNALRSAAADPRVLGAFLIEGYFVRPKRYFLYYFATRILKPKTWFRLLRGRLNIPSIFKTFVQSIRGEKIKEETEAGQVQEMLFENMVLSDLRSLVKRGANLCFVYSRGSPAHYNYRSRLQKEIRSLETQHQIEVILFDRTDHTFTPLPQQEKLIEAVQRWFQGNFGQGTADHPGSGSKTKPLSHSSPPALVLGSNITALGVVRSLGREKIPLYYACYERDFVTKSRWARPIYSSLEEFSGSAQLAQFLKSLPTERMVLFPCSDSWARAIAGLDSEMAARFSSSLTTLENLEMLSDKGAFSKVLVKNNLPHPRTRLLHSKEDLETLPAEEFEGAFLKPCRSQEFSSYFGVKAFRVQSREDALRRFEEIQKAGFAVVLQEYIPGPTDQHYFIDGFVNRAGQVCAHFARRRLRMDPPDFGNSSYLVSIPEREVGQAVDSIDRLLSAIHFRGIFSVEFKFDRRDRRFKMLEVNARPWWFIEFASTSGVNVCRLAYEDALGLAVKPIKSYLVGSRCVNPYYDLFSCYRLYRNHELTLGAWIKSWWGAKQPKFCWDDLLPAVWSFFQWIRSYLLHHLFGIKSKE